MTTVFVSILEKGLKQGFAGQRTVEAKEWFRNEAQKTKITPEIAIRRSRQQLGSDDVKNPYHIGRLMLFHYDPLHKATLPYYDRFPLVFPFNVTQTGFYGINMHYLPLPQRAMLMDGLYKLLNNTDYNDTTKLKLNYQILSSYASLKYFKPCVKHYLNSQIRSQFIVIPADQWDIALFMPLERFAKQSRSVVHSQSLKIARNII